MSTRAGEIEQRIKSWIFPSLVTIISALIWRDITELKSDVKALLAQSNIDKTRIDNLERQVYGKITHATVVIKSKSKDKDGNKFFYHNRELAIVENREKKRLTLQLKRSKNEA